MNDLPAVQRLQFEVLLFVFVERVVMGDVVVRDQQKAARSRSRVADGLTGGGAHGVHHGLNERARREVLSRPALGILRVLFQQTLISVALDVGVQAGPSLFINKIGDQAAQHGRVFDLVLRLAEDDAQHARLLAQLFQRVPVVNFQRIAVQGQQGRPVVTLRHDGGAAVRGLCALIGHLQEQQVRELLEVIAVRKAIVTQDVAVVPEFLYQRARTVIAHFALPLQFLFLWPRYLPA